VTEANRTDGNPAAGNGAGRSADYAAADTTAAAAGTTAAADTTAAAAGTTAAADTAAAAAGSIGTVVVIIPTYNESDNLEDIVARTRRAVPDADVLVVDDNSPDGTGDLAEKLALTDEHVHVLHRTQKAGLGAAYLAGFDWALDRGYGVLVEMDADGSHDPAELPSLLAALANADLVVGSRWVNGGTVRNWPRSREILSRGGNAYARIMLRLSVHDATGGYRAYRANTLRRIGLREVRSQGYCFQIELTLRTVRAGLTVAEVPITFTERAKGTSKMNRSIVAEALWRVTVWSLTRRGSSRY
jgi:dolichol-phosphate mannosyltransferase